MLSKIGSEAYALAEVDDISKTLEGESRRVNYKELLHPKVIKILALGVFIAMFQQWCGINVIFNYAQEIF